MKRVIVVIVIFLLIIGIIPIHELGHVIIAKILGGEVRNITWLSLSPITDSQGKYYGGWVDIENIPYDWRFALVVLAGGMFQGLIYIRIGFILLKRKSFKMIFGTCFVLGILGLAKSFYELWLANKGIYPA